MLGRGADLRQRRLDPRPRVDRGEHHRQVLGQAEQPVGLQHLVAAEALGAAQQDAGGQAVALADAQERVAQELAAGPVALGEVRGELEAVLVHSAAPTACPRRHGGEADDQRAQRGWPARRRSWSSCPSRWLSSIHVDSVV